MRASVAFCVGGLLAGVLVWAAMHKKTVVVTNRIEYTQPPTAADALADREPTLQEQLTCSTATEGWLKVSEYSDRQNVQRTSHYSPKLGHCYGMFSVEEPNVNGGYDRTRSVFDPIQGTVLGEALFDGTMSSKVTEVTCYMSKADGEGKNCNDLIEFSDLARDWYGLVR